MDFSRTQITVATSGLALWDWYQRTKQRTLTAGIPVSELDWLMQTLLKLDRLMLRLGSLKDVASVSLPLSLAELDELWDRRLQEHVPVQYLAGQVSWRRLMLQVSPAVLIPRPETEGLIDWVLELRATAPWASSLGQGEHWADLGTGSGAIALGLALELPQAQIHAVDVSEAALAIAQGNALLLAQNPIQSIQSIRPVHFYQGSWFEPLHHLKGQLHGVVSNPPYIPSFLIPTLQAEVANHEPHLALDGGTDGLECIRHLVEMAPTYLHAGGIWATEMMAGQGEAVAELLRQQGCYGGIQIHCDLAGFDRFAVAYFCP